jgi:hypothetical protein
MTLSGCLGRQCLGGPALLCAFFSRLPLCADRLELICKDCGVRTYRRGSSSDWTGRSGHKRGWWTGRKGMDDQSRCQFDSLARPRTGGALPMGPSACCIDIHKNPASQRRALFIMQANSGSHTALLENAGTPQGLNLQLDPHKQPRLSGRPNRLFDARELHTILPVVRHLPRSRCSNLWGHASSSACRWTAGNRSVTSLSSV